MDIDYVDISFDFKTSVELFLLNNFSHLCFCIKHRKKKMKMIDITKMKVKENLDALQLMKSLRYLNQVGQKSKTPFFEPK